MEDCLNAMREYDADLVMFQFDTISENNKPLLSNYRHNDFTEVQVLTPVEVIKSKSRLRLTAISGPSCTRLHLSGTGFSFPVGRKIEDLSRICNVIGEATRVVRLPQGAVPLPHARGSITASWDPQLTRDWTRAADDREEYIVHRFPRAQGLHDAATAEFLCQPRLRNHAPVADRRLKIDPETPTRFVAASRA